MQKGLLWRENAQAKERFEGADTYCRIWRLPAGSGLCTRAIDAGAASREYRWSALWYREILWKRTALWRRAPLRRGDVSRPGKRERTAKENGTGDLGEPEDSQQAP